MAKQPIVDIGDEIRSPVEFTVDGVLTDPTDVTVKVQLGDNSEATFTSPVAGLPTGDIKRTADEPLGVFEHSFVCTIAGETTVRWFGDGVLNAAWERTFTVKASRFATPLAKS